MPRIPQPRALNPNLSGLEKKDPMVVACSEKMFPWEIIGVMVQMMEVRFEIRKTPFSRQLTLKK
jgi:hypothetical protein